ncbi:Ubiquitin carboxyl-terminal hydrolase [Dirofilaria immitis]
MGVFTTGQKAIPLFYVSLLNFLARNYKCNVCIFFGCYSNDRQKVSHVHHFMEIYSHIIQSFYFMTE